MFDKYTTQEQNILLFGNLSFVTRGLSEKIGPVKQSVESVGLGFENSTVRFNRSFNWSYLFSETPLKLTHYPKDGGV